MKKGAICLCLLMVLGALTGCAAGAESDVWMYAVSVGKADAILLGVGDAVCLIDSGNAYSRGRILAAMERMGVERLDAVFVTHTDDDHVGGLEWLAESGVEVGTWYASAMFVGVKESKHPAVKAAQIRGEEVVWLRAGDQVALGSGVLRVLAPEVPNADKDDNNSLVMMLETAEGRILLAGDMEFPEEAVLLESGADLSCDVLKVANHADNDTTSEAFVRAAQPKVAVICTDTWEKPETPDPRVVASLQAAGAQVAVTQECTGGILVRLAGGVPSVERIDVPAPGSDVVVEDVVPGEDVIVLYNRGAEAAELSGWYLFSQKGEEMLVFPGGTVLQPGARLVIGTKTSAEEGEDFDLFWDDKKVVHQSKEDVIVLYDVNGTQVSSMSNGF